MESKDLKLIGRKERVTIPELGFQNIEARIDTGAYTSALHCSNIRTEVMNGVETLVFKVFDEVESDHTTKEFYFDRFSETIVKSSNGLSEKRYKIITELVIGSELINSEFTLADRSEMKHPVLIGRKTLKNRYIVDVSLKFVQE